MTDDDKAALVAALQLLLGDKADHDIIYVLGGAFPQFKLLYHHQFLQIRQGLDDLSGKAQILRAQI